MSTLGIGIMIERSIERVESGFSNLQYDEYSTVLQFTHIFASFFHWAIFESPSRSFVLCI